PRPARGRRPGVRRPRGAHLAHGVRLADGADAAHGRDQLPRAGVAPAPHAAAGALPRAVRPDVHLVPGARRDADELLALRPGAVRLAPQAGVRRLPRPRPGRAVTAA